MVLKSTSAGNVSVYQVSGTNVSRSLPDWIAKKRKRSLKNDAEYQNRIELIQDFEFQEASNKIKVTPDGQFAMATGTYKPQIHVYDFANLSLKFDRHTDCENVDFLILSNDWTKSIHLQNDRSIEFQTKGGIHYKTRIPKFGRDMALNENTCDLLIAALGNELYRLNLDQGRFLNPYLLDTSSGVNSVEINKVHGLISVGLEDGCVEFWDSRARQRAAKLFVSDQLGEDCSITSTAFRNDGLNFACGTLNGKSLIYDLRTSTPSIVKDQGYGFEVKKIIWLDENNAGNDCDKIMTTDKRIAKVWDRMDGKPFASMEPSVDINDVEYIRDSGMFFVANEGSPMHTYYIPELGPAPKWCSFLDNITEELEEKPTNTVYSNYRFITRDEVTKLNLSHLVGSKVLRSYMHGFFIDNELYDKVNLIANPNSIQDQREREIRKRIEKERESRIRTTGAVTNTKIKVNKGLADKLQERQGTNAAETVINDDRFKEMFENPEYAVDEQSHEYKQLNPVKSTTTKDISGVRSRGLTAAEESDEERANMNDGAGSDSDDSNSDDDEDDKDDEEEEEDDAATAEMKEKQRKMVQKEMDRLRKKKLEKTSTDRFMNEMTAVSKDDINSKSSVSFGSQVKRNAKEYKVQKQNNDSTRLQRHARGEAELTFVPQKQQKQTRFAKLEQDSDDEEEKVKNSGRTKQRFDGRRRASKNAFRGM